MSREFSSLLVTGGSGFIGTNFIRYLFGKSLFKGRVVNLDALTYAGNPENLADIEKAEGGKRYFFERGDICDRQKVESLFAKYKVDAIVHYISRDVQEHMDRMDDDFTLIALKRVVPDGVLARSAH